MVYPDELWAFLAVLVAIAAFVLLCLWLGGAFVPVVHASPERAVSAAASAPPPTAAPVQLPTPGPSPVADRFPFLSDEAIRELWSDAEPTEPWSSAVRRALDYCDGAAEERELYTILRLHPRALRERDWQAAVIRHVAFIGEGDDANLPVCRFFMMSVLGRPRSDRVQHGRFESEEVSPSF